MKATIQPIQSLLDDVVAGRRLAAADARGLAMVVTGMRHFRH
jgi:AICAR transformylase/IMP cyclohydrolase PurH